MYILWCSCLCREGDVAQHLECQVCFLRRFAPCCLVSSAADAVPSMCAVCFEVVCRASVFPGTSESAVSCEYAGGRVAGVRRGCRLGWGDTAPPHDDHQCTGVLSAVGCRTSDSGWWLLQPMRFVCLGSRRYDFICAALVSSDGLYEPCCLFWWEWRD